MIEIYLSDAQRHVLFLRGELETGSTCVFLADLHIVCIVSAYSEILPLICE